MANPRVPVVEGLFREEDGSLTLIGSRCTGCGTMFFPRAYRCNNPECPGGSVEDADLGKNGRIHSFTVQHYPPPPPFKAPEPFTPFAVGLVELSCGLRVLGMVDSGDPESLKIGDEVEVIGDVMYTNENGEDVTVWKFRPVGTAD